MQNRLNTAPIQFEHLSYWEIGQIRLRIVEEKIEKVRMDHMPLQRSTVIWGHEVQT